MALPRRDPGPGGPKKPVEKKKQQPPPPDVLRGNYQPPNRPIVPVQPRPRPDLGTRLPATRPQPPVTTPARPPLPRPAPSPQERDNRPRGGVTPQAPAAIAVLPELQQARQWRGYEQPFAGEIPLSQRWGSRPEVYKSAGWAGHAGLDWIMPEGTSIKTSAPGVVKVVGLDRGDGTGYGNYVVVEHDNGDLTYYGHMSNFSVKEGDRVDYGTELGLSGNTGFSEAPHLHFGYKPAGGGPEGFAGYADPSNLFGERPASPSVRMVPYEDVPAVDLPANWQSLPPSHMGVPYRFPVVDNPAQPQQPRPAPTPDWKPPAPDYPYASTSSPQKPQPRPWVSGSTPEEFAQSLAGQQGYWYDTTTMRDYRQRTAERNAEQEAVRAELTAKQQAPGSGVALDAWYGLGKGLSYGRQYGANAMDYLNNPFQMAVLEPTDWWGVRYTRNPDGTVDFTPSPGAPTQTMPFGPIVGGAIRSVLTPPQGDTVRERFFNAGKAFQAPLQNYAAAQQAVAAIDDPELRASAEIGLLAGANAWRPSVEKTAEQMRKPPTYGPLQAVEAIRDQQRLVTAKRAQAARYMEQGQWVEAGKLLAEANAYEQMQPYQLADQQKDIAGNVMQAVLLDPLNLIEGGFMLAGLAADAARGGRALKAATEPQVMNFALEADKALQQAADLQRAAGVVAGAATQATDLRNIAGRPAGEVASKVPFLKWFSLTPESFAKIRTGEIFQYASGIVNKLAAGGEVTGGDVLKVLQTAVTNPMQLTRGLKAGEFAGPAVRALAADPNQLIQWGAQLVVPKNLKDFLPVLAYAMPDIAKLPSLQNVNEVVDMAKFTQEFDDAIYDAARRLYGRSGLMQVPLGTDIRNGIRIADAGNGQQSVAFFTKDGRLISTTAPMDAKAAQKAVKDWQKAAKAPGNVISGTGKAIAGAQRAIMTDFFLGLSPRNWILNAATAHLASTIEGQSTLGKSIGEIDAYMRAKLGEGMGNRRINEGLMGATSGLAHGSHWTDAFPNNRLAQAWGKVATGALNVPYGRTELSGALGVGFGEQNMYTRAFYSVLKRVVDRNADRIVNGILLNDMVQMGVNPAYAKRVVETVSEAVRNGGQQDIVTAVRQAVTGQTAPHTMASAGVVAGTISPDAERALNQLLSEHPADWEQQAAAIFERELQPHLDTLMQAPPDYHVDEWMKQTKVQDADLVFSALYEAARNQGQGKQAAAQAARTAAQAINADYDAAVKGIMADLRTMQPNPEIMRQVVGGWAELHAMLRKMRQTIDEASNTVPDAIKAGAPPQVAWQQKWDATLKAAQDFVAARDQWVIDWRDRIQRAAAGEEVPAPGDWRDLLNSYIAYDDAAVQQVRGLEAGAALRDGEYTQQYSDIIAANRAFEDASYVRLYDAVRLNGTVDALDILYSARKMTDNIMTAAGNAVAKERMRLLAGKLKPQDFYTFRNEQWRKARNAVVQYNEYALRYILQDAAQKATQAKMTWGDLTLIGPAGNGKWIARKAGQFQPQMLDEANVPPEVMAAWRQGVTPQAQQQAVDEAVAAIDEVAPPPQAVAEPAPAPVAETPQVAAEPEVPPVPWPEPETVSVPEPAPAVEPPISRTTPAAVAAAKTQIPNGRTGLFGELNKAFANSPRISGKATDAKGLVRPTYLYNSIRKHAGEIGIKPPASLAEMTDDDIRKAIAWYGSSAEQAVEAAPPPAAAAPAPAPRPVAGEPDLIDGPPLPMQDRRRVLLPGDVTAELGEVKNGIEHWVAIERGGRYRHYFQRAGEEWNPVSASQQDWRKVWTELTAPPPPAAAQVADVVTSGTLPPVSSIEKLANELEAINQSALAGERHQITMPLLTERAEVDEILNYARTGQSKRIYPEMPPALLQRRDPIALQQEINSINDEIRLLDRGTAYNEKFYPSAGISPESLATRRQMDAHRRAFLEAQKAQLEALLPKGTTVPNAPAAAQSTVQVAAEPPKVPTASGKPELVGYEWRSTLGEGYSSYEGGLVSRRVSDWDKSTVSKGSGRDIVHVYYIREPDGTINAYGKQTALQRLGISDTQLKRRADQYVAEAMHKKRVAESMLKEFGERPTFDTVPEAVRAFRERNPYTGPARPGSVLQGTVVYTKDGKYQVLPDSWGEIAKQNGWAEYRVFDPETRGYVAPASAVEAAPTPPRVLGPQDVQTPAGKATIVGSEQRNGRAMYIVRTEDGKTHAFAPDNVTIDGQPAPDILLAEGVTKQWEQDAFKYASAIDPAARAELRAQMKDMWQQAVAEWTLPSLDNLYLQYKRRGLPEELRQRIGQSGSSKGLKYRWEDFLGSDNALNLHSADDVARFLDQYGETSKAAVKRATAAAGPEPMRAGYPGQQYLGWSKADIIEDNRQLFLDNGMSAQEITDLQQAPNEYILSLLDSLKPTQAGRGFEDVTRFYEGGNLGIIFDPITYQMFEQGSEWVRRMGGKRTQTIGDLAAHNIRTVQEAQRAFFDMMRRGPDMVPNTLTPQQRQAILDLTYNRLLPAFDNLLSEATEAGRRGADRTMLNYDRRRGFDEILSILSPYHYYWSRAPLNWGMRLVRHPAALGMIADWQNTWQRVSEQQRNYYDPQRTEGKIDFGLPLGPIGNYLDKILPFAGLMGNPFTDTEMAMSPAEYAYLWMKQQGMPLWGPMGELAIAAMLDYATPRPEGVEPRWKDFGVSDLIGGLGRTASALGQAVTGKVTPTFFSGDQFRTGVAGRELASMESDATPTERLWGMDVLDQQQSYWPRQFTDPKMQPLPEQPDSAIPLAKQAAQQAGWQDFGVAMLNWGLGLNANPYGEQEKYMNEMSAARRALGFNEETGLGSAAAVKGFDEATGGITYPWSQYHELYPQITLNPEEEERLGVTAARRERSAEMAPVIAARDEGVEAVAASVQPPNTPTEETFKAGSARLEQLDARYEKEKAGIYENYPSVPEAAEKRDMPPVNGVSVPFNKYNPYYNMSPDEAQARFEEDAEYWAYLVTQEKLGERPTFPESPRKTNPNASDAQMDAYDVARRKAEQGTAAWNQAFENNYATILSSQPLVDALTFRDQLEPGQEPPPGLANVQAIPEEEALKRIREVLSTNEPREQFYEAQSDFYDQKDAQFNANIASRMSPEVANLLEQYYNLPRVGNAREDFQTQHPELRLAKIAGNYPTEYDEAVKLFGEDAVKAWGYVPAWIEGSEEQDALRDQYYAAHPEAFIVGAWINGRRKPDSATTTPEDYYDFGKDYAYAINKWGDNVWEVAGQYKAGDRATRRGMYKQYGWLEEFWNWWYEYWPETEDSKKQGIRGTWTGGYGYGGIRSRGGSGSGSGSGDGRFPYWQQPEGLYTQEYLDNPWAEQVQKLKRWRPPDMPRPEVVPQLTRLRNWR